MANLRSSSSEGFAAWIRDANGRLVGAALGAENGHSITMGADEPSGRYIVEVQLFTAGQATYDLAVDGG